MRGMPDFHPGHRVPGLVPPEYGNHPLPHARLPIVQTQAVDVQESDMTFTFRCRYLSDATAKRFDWFLTFENFLKSM